MATINVTNSSVAAQEWQELLEEIVPAQGRWTEEQYLAMTDHTNRLLEFTDGILEVLPMPTDRHQHILMFLYRTFFAFLQPRGGDVLVAPLRMRIRRGKFREPDLLLFRSAADPRRQNRFWTGADLALEVVSEDKPERDLVDKVVDYAEGRIPEYWIVNPQTEKICVRRLQVDSYVQAGEYGRGQMAESVELEGFAVDVSAVLDAGLNPSPKS
jgi:Uma2 family endonuclease